MTKVFISYSSHCKPSSIFVKELYKVLTNAHVPDGSILDVFLDRESISTGERWQEKILQHLCECDVFVLVLTKEALKSPWVKQEAAFSAIRQYGDPGLKIIITPQEKDFPVSLIQNCDSMGKIAQLHRIQFNKGLSSSTEIANQILAHETYLYAPIGDLIPKLCEIFQQENIPDNAIQRSIQKINSVGLNSLPNGSKLPYSLAISLVMESNHTIERFNEVIKSLYHAISQEKATAILNMIHHLWISAHQSKNLAFSQKNRFPVYLNCTDEEYFTTKSLSNKTWGKGHCKVVCAGDSRNYSEIETLLIHAFKSRKAMNQETARKRLQKNQAPILLVFPESDMSNSTFDHYPDSALLRQLLDTYPTLCILVKASQEILRTDLKPLDISFDLLFEEKQYTNYCDALDSIEQLYNIG